MKLMKYFFFPILTISGSSGRIIEINNSRLSLIVPDRSDKVCESIIIEKVNIDFEFLANNILLTRLKTAIELDP